jgi:hypothetical protein
MAQYWELLQDPRWQRKRLEILSRDIFTCKECGATDKPLHVHHKIYIKGLKPWEYKEQLLTTLCNDCHESEEALIISFKSLLADILASGVDYWEIGSGLAELFPSPKKEDLAPIDLEDMPF